MATIHAFEQKFRFQVHPAISCLRIIYIFKDGFLPLQKAQSIDAECSQKNAQENNI